MLVVRRVHIIDSQCPAFENNFPLSTFKLQPTYSKNLSGNRALWGCTGMNEDDSGKNVPIFKITSFC